MNAADAVPIAVGLLAVAACAAFALLPLVRQSAAPRVSAEMAQPAERFDLYRQVVDLEFDRQTGKLSAEDLEVLRAELLARATTLAREQQRDDRDIAEQVEAEIAAARAALRGQQPAAVQESVA